MSVEIDWGETQKPIKNKKLPARQKVEIDWGEEPIGQEHSIGAQALGAEGDYLKGLGKGTLEKLGQFGASAANVPSSIYKYLTGKPGYHVNAPYEAAPPASESEAAGQRMGQAPADFLALLPAFGAGRFISKAPEGASLIAKLLQSGKKLGTVAGTGALEGLAFGEPERFQKAKEYGLESGITEGIGQLLSKGLSFRPSAKYKRAEKSYQQAVMNRENAEQSLNEAKGRASEDVSLTTPEKIAPRIETKTAAIDDALKVLDSLPTEAFPSQVMHEAYTQLPHLAQENLNELNHQISVHMGAGSNPDKPLAESTMQYFEGPRVEGKQTREGGLRTEIGNIFNDVRDSLKDSRINIETKIKDEDLTRMAESSLRKLFEATKQEAFTPTQMQRAKEAIKADLKVGQGKSINAQTYFDDYREVEDSQGKIISKLKQAKNGKINLSDKEIRDLKIKASEMQAKMNDMELNLKNQLNPEIFQRFELAKNRWANEYAPVRNNPIFQLMRDKGIVSSNDLMGELRSEDRGSVILRRYFQTNPEAAGLLANYQYANNPMGLQSLTPYQTEFINPQLTPYISHLINEQSNAIQNVNRAQQQATHFEDLSKSIKEEQKRHNTLLSERQKLEKQVPEWKKEIELLTKHEDILKKEIKNKNLTKAQESAKKEELAQAKKRKENFGRRISEIAKYGSIEEYLRRNFSQKSREKEEY